MTGKCATVKEQQVHILATLTTLIQIPNIVCDEECTNLCSDCPDKSLSDCYGGQTEIDINDQYSTELTVFMEERGIVIVALYFVSIINTCVN